MLTKVIDADGFNAVVKGKYGYVLYNKNDIYIGRAIEKYGEFSESEVVLFKQICSAGEVVVEVGANIGTHTLVLSQLVGKNGRIYAFEPQRIVFQTLCANMALNNITNVECFQAAVGEKTGFIQIPDIEYDRQGNFGGIEVKQFQQGVKVPLVQLDTVLEIPRLKLLKIDVEGMEYEVLQGAIALIKRHKPLLYIENDRMDKSQRLIEFIKSLDYRMFWHLPPLFNPKNFAGDTDNLYPNLVSVNMFCIHRTINLNIEGFQEVTDAHFHPLRRSPQATEVTKLLEEGLAQHREGRLAFAEELYRLALQKMPNSPDAYHLLGLAMSQSGRLEEAVQLISKAIELKSNQPEYYVNLGNALQKNNQLESALAAYHRALQLNPHSAIVYSNQAAVLFKLKRLMEAIASCDHALRLQPNYHDALLNKARIFKELDRLEESLENCNLALRLQKTAMVFNLKASVLLDLGRLEEALTVSNETLALFPNDINALVTQSYILKGLKRLEAALDSCNLALTIQTTSAILNAKTLILSELGHLEEAMAVNEQTLQLFPDNAEAYNSRGVVLGKKEGLATALTAFEQALRLEPNYVDAHCNKGSSLCLQGYFPEGQQAFNQVLRIRPQHPLANLHLALLLLLHGKLKEGWQKYEWRRQKMQSFPQPQWDGSFLENKTILLHPEQGIGDCIQFIRYVPLVAEKVSKVIVQCPTVLKSLFATMPDIQLLVGKEEPLPSFEVHAPLMSLPYLLGTTLETIPADIPYLFAPNPHSLTDEEVGIVNGKHNVGIVWAGSSSYANDKMRSIELVRWQPLLELNKVNFISLQVGERSQEVNSISRPLKDLSPLLTDFSRTASAIAKLDLVISVDTAVAHLAGAMGKPVWALLPFVPDWRWLLHRGDSPWYPNVRLFRQPKMDDWESVMQRVRRELQN